MFMCDIMRKPMASMPRSLAALMCCSVMSASVQCTAMRATLTPRSRARLRSSTVPMPGTSRTAIWAFVVAWTAASMSVSSSTALKP